MPRQTEIFTRQCNGRPSGRRESGWFSRENSVMKLKLDKKLVFAVMAGLSLVASAQTVITNGVQKYASLASTTVIMSNRCELWVTNSVTPLSGCTINLNSADAWLFLPG